MSWRPCWRYNTKNMLLVIFSGGWHCFPHPERLIANQELCPIIMHKLELLQNFQFQLGWKTQENRLITLYILFVNRFNLIYHIFWEWIWNSIIFGIGIIGESRKNLILLVAVYPKCTILSQPIYISNLVFFSPKCTILHIYLVYIHPTSKCQGKWTQHGPDRPDLPQTSAEEVL